MKLCDWVESNYVGGGDFCKQDKHLWGGAPEVRRSEERQEESLAEHLDRAVSCRKVRSCKRPDGKEFWRNNKEARGQKQIV